MSTASKLNRLKEKEAAGTYRTRAYGKANLSFERLESGELRITMFTATGTLGSVHVREHEAVATADALLRTAFGIQAKTYDTGSEWRKSLLLAVSAATHNETIERMENERNVAVLDRKATELYNEFTFGTQKPNEPYTMYSSLSDYEKKRWRRMAKLVVEAVEWARG